MPRDPTDIIEQIDAALGLADRAARVEALLGYPNSCVPGLLRQLAQDRLTALIHPCRDWLRARRLGRTA